MATSELEKTRTETLIQKDKKYIWHPFTQMQDWQEEDILVIERGEGVYLIDSEGKRYLDGVSSLWCNVHGHRVKELDEALREQINKISHTTFLGLSNVPAIELAEALIKIAPEGLTRVFYSDSGSEAVEIALKMAYQYWSLKGHPNKKKFVKLSEAYHGDTIGSVSVGGIDLFHRIFGSLLFETYSVPTPYRYRWEGKEKGDEVGEVSLAALENILKENHQNIAALVMEPLIQGAAGMVDQPQGYISRARELTKKYNVLLIFDEVATGFGRTGKMFAANHEGVTPDLMCAAKNLTGGYLPLAVTLTSEEVYEAFLGKYEDFKSFFHGHTYTANPLACSVALENLKLFERKSIIEGLKPKINLVKEKLENFKSLEAVGDVRQVGLMIGIELVKNKDTKELFKPDEKISIKVVNRAREKGVIIRPLGQVIILMPPLGMTDEELTQLLDVTYSAIKEITNEALAK